MHATLHPLREQKGQLGPKKGCDVLYGALQLYYCQQQFQGFEDHFMFKIQSGNKQRKLWNAWLVLSDGNEDPQTDKCDAMVPHNLTFPRYTNTFCFDDTLTKTSEGATVLTHSFPKEIEYRQRHFLGFHCGSVAHFIFVLRYSETRLGVPCLEVSFWKRKKLRSSLFASLQSWHVWFLAAWVGRRPA